jgi:hypothetical protein
MNQTTLESSSRFARWRRELADPQCIFVEPAEFVRLATSWRKLERRNEPDCDVAGLYDPATGEWFVVEEKRLSETLDARGE